MRRIRGVREHGVLAHDLWTVIKQLSPDPVGRLSESVFTHRPVSLLFLLGLFLGNEYMCHDPFYFVLYPVISVSYSRPFEHAILIFSADQLLLVQCLEVLCVLRRRSSRFLERGRGEEREIGGGKEGRDRLRKKRLTIKTERGGGN